MYLEISNPMDYHVALYIRLSKEDESEGANGMVFHACIRTLVAIPESEMAEVRTFENLPENNMLTYPAITPVLFCRLREEAN